MDLSIGRNCEATSPHNCNEVGDILPRYKLIAIDMDGTLLNSDLDISERTVKAINKAVEKGVNIVLSTGRILRSAISTSNRLKLNNYIIACNGGIIVNETNDIIHSLPIGMDSIEKIMYLGRKHNVYYHFYNEESLFSNTYIKEIVDFYNERDLKMDIKVFKDEKEILSSKDLNIYKFLFIDNDIEKLSKLRKELSQITNLGTTKSWENNMEVMDYNASKGRGLDMLCKKLNINKENVIAIGDSDNDLSMIKYAGLGVSMGNGNDIIKKEAQYITDTNDKDGVAKVIEKFIL